MSDEINVKRGNAIVVIGIVVIIIIGLLVSRSIETGKNQQAHEEFSNRISQLESHDRAANGANKWDNAKMRVWVATLCAKNESLDCDDVMITDDWPK